MTFSDESYNLRIELDQKGCELSAEQIGKIEDSLTTLRKVVESFPVSNLYVTIVYHQRSDDYHVKTSLALSGKTLFTGDRDVQFYPAFERCVRKLVRKVNSYKTGMRHDEELAKVQEGTHQVVMPTVEIDAVAAQAAADELDYVRFRECLAGFESPLHSRVGRWLQRYPEIEQRLGDELTISDLVEEVFLNAMDQFSKRSHDVPPGDWLEQLIDPSVQAILQSPDEEFANISFAKSLRETVQE